MKVYGTRPSPEDRNPVRRAMRSPRSVLLWRQVTGAPELQYTARHTARFTENGHGGEYAHHQKQREENDGNDQNRHNTPRRYCLTATSLPR
jgi:hypothetical protein